MFLLESQTWTIFSDLRFIPVRKVGKRCIFGKVISGFLIGFISGIYANELVFHQASSFYRLFVVKDCRCLPVVCNALRDFVNTSK